MNPQLGKAARLTAYCDFSTPCESSPSEQYVLGLFPNIKIGEKRNLSKIIIYKN